MRHNKILDRHNGYLSRLSIRLDDPGWQQERAFLCVSHQRHKTEIHVQLHVAVVEREPGIIRDEIDFGALAARHVDRVFADARCRLSADPC